MEHQPRTHRRPRGSTGRTTPIPSSPECPEFTVPGVLMLSNASTMALRCPQETEVVLEQSHVPPGFPQTPSSGEWNAGLTRPRSGRRPAKRGWVRDAEWMWEWPAPKSGRDAGMTADEVAYGLLHRLTRRITVQNDHALNLLSRQAAAMRPWCDYAVRAENLAGMLTKSRAGLYFGRTWHSDTQSVFDQVTGIGHRVQPQYDECSKVSDACTDAIKQGLELAQSTLESGQYVRNAEPLGDLNSRARWIDGQLTVWQRALAGLEEACAVGFPDLTQPALELETLLEFDGFLEHAQTAEHDGSLVDQDWLQDQLRHDGIPARVETVVDDGVNLTMASLIVPTSTDLLPDRSRSASGDLHRHERASAFARRYANGLAQIALRVLELLSSAVESRDLVVNLWAKGTSPATGQESRDCVLSVKCASVAIQELRLRAIDPLVCLRSLRGSVVDNTKSGTRPIRPLIDFDKNDPRFIAGANLVATLDTRPNLMEMTPTEFEQLVTDLFSAMGLDAHLTRASRDGGVDCVAYDSRPVLGGKIIIQAKRYRNMVGVSAVRDLFGAVHNEGATKGILVTTSTLGRGSHEFAEGKPLELLDGSNLLHLLSEHLNLQARIEMISDVIGDDQEPPFSSDTRTQ